jgi:AraC family transcriptional regulator
MKFDTVQRHSASVQKVLEHILIHREDSTSIENLSRVACFAPFHFHRVFRSVTGDSIQRYIRRLRLHYSVNQLLFTEETILSIALQAGYQSHEGFTRAFQQNLGVPPSSLRAFSASACRAGSSGGISESVSKRMAACLFSVPVQHGSLIRRKVIFRSHFGPYGEVHECWKQLYAQARTCGLNLDTSQPIGIMYDHPLRCERVRYDACLTVDSDFKGTSDLAMQVITARECVVASHHGPYSLSPYTYMQLVNQCALKQVGSIAHLPYYEVHQHCFPITGYEAIADIFVPLSAPGAKRNAESS